MFSSLPYQHHFTDDERTIMNAHVFKYYFHKNNYDYLKRLFLTSLGIRAIHHKVKYCPLLLDFRMCFRMYLAAVPDPYLTVNEVKCLLHTCLFFINRLDLLDFYTTEFEKLIPECPNQLEPRRLKDLARVKLRNILCKKSDLPQTLNKLSLTEDLKDFILGDVIDIRSKNEHSVNIS